MNFASKIIYALSKDRMIKGLPLVKIIIKIVFNGI